MIFQAAARRNHPINSPSLHPACILDIVTQIIIQDDFEKISDVLRHLSPFLEEYISRDSDN